MIRFMLNLTPGELRVFENMVKNVLTWIQGDGSLNGQDDDNLASLNQKLLQEMRKHSNV